MMRICIGGRWQIWDKARYSGEEQKWHGDENMYRGQMADFGQSEVKRRRKTWHGDENMYRWQMADLTKARYSGKEERDNKTRPLTPMHSLFRSIRSTHRDDCR